MAKKSKTQRAKASAARAARKAQARDAEQQTGTQPAAEAVEAEPTKKKLFKKADAAEKAPEQKQAKKAEQKVEKKAEKKPAKKKRFQFLRDVRSEMKRVTWPTKQDVMRWSGVVVVALLFFGVFAFALDSVFLQVLTVVSGIGA